MNAAMNNAIKGLLITEDTIYKPTCGDKYEFSTLKTLCNDSTVLI